MPPRDPARLPLFPSLKQKKKSGCHWSIDVAGNWRKVVLTTNSFFSVDRGQKGYHFRGESGPVPGNVFVGGTETGEPAIRFSYNGPGRLAWVSENGSLRNRF